MMVETPTVTEPATTAINDTTPRAPERPLRNAASRVLAIAVVALVAMIVAWGVFSLFEGPVARSWYANRQRQLASQFASSRTHAGKGAAIAVMQIPKLGLNLVVAEGDSPQQLRSGPGHRFGTPLPGDIGNSIVSGHRTGWSGPFNDLASLRDGDLIVVQTLDADGAPRNGVFKVQSSSRVGARDVGALGPSTDRRLTLVTGRGGRFSDQLLVVTALSGTAGRIAPAPLHMRATTAPGSSLLNAEMLLVLFGFGGALALWFVVRRRYHPAAIAIVLAPLVAIGSLGLLLNVDAMLPPLR